MFFFKSSVGGKMAKLYVKMCPVAIALLHVGLIVFCVCVSGRDPPLPRSKLASLHPPSGTWDPNCSFFETQPAITGIETIFLGDWCQCLGTVADCSGVGMGRIPHFDREITTLLFSSNNLAEYEESFSRIPNVTHLDLSYNNIWTITYGMFYSLKRLKVLDFRGNVREFRGAEMLMRMAQLDLIEELDASMDYHSYGIYPTELFPIGPPPMPHLRVLVLDYYNYVNISLDELQHLSKFRELSFVGIQSTYSVFSSAHMPNLEKLNLSHNSLLKFIDTCYDINLDSPEPLPEVFGSFFPRLKSLDLSGTVIGLGMHWDYEDEVCLPELRTLALEYNFIRSIESGMFSTFKYKCKFVDVSTPCVTIGDIRYPKLENLSLKAAGLISAIKPYAFNNSALLTLDLTLNKIEFASDDISPHAFAGCTSIVELNFEGNIFRGISEEKFQSLFAPLESLLVLNIGNTKLEKVSKGLFSCITSVTTLLLHDNLISSIPDGTFDDLEHLTVLRLDNNQIVSVRESTFHYNTRGHLKSLNISHNPFDCTCSLMWFRDWVTAHPRMFESDVRSRYGCKNLPGMDLSGFMQNKQPCLLGHNAYVFTVVCSVALISILILASQLYRYRWHIRLVLYEVFRGKPSARWQQRRPEDFRYDLFVSYDSEDERWVTEHLMQALEEGVGLRLCVHQRDFIPGKNIVDNIVDNLEVSRRVLAVFSPTFAESQWCHFELEMCLSHVIDRNDVMVVVMLQHVPSRDMSGAMLALINTTTYIEWGDDPEFRASFWRKMTLALTNILPGLGH